MNPSSTCPECGSAIPDGAPEGLCPECLLGAGVEAGTLGDPTLDSGDDRAPDLAGQTIGRYKLLQHIGEGGFGVVYMAEQTEPLKRRVALKVIKPGMDSKEIVGRFEAERQALALMDHRHIAQVYDAGTTEGGRPYFVMELVKGVPITEYCADHQLETKARLNLFSDVCSAVQHAHQKGVIHRDLKPSNILVSPHDGEPVVKVIDFGIAKAVGMELTEKTVFTQLGRMIGSPQYMSPEQAELNALDVDTRSDIYSLGVVLYELLTGTTPLDGEQLRSAAYDEMQRLIREETPPKPSTRITALHEQPKDTARRTPLPTLPKDLDWITMKALEKERERRYETAGDFAQDIGRHLLHEPVTAGPPSAGYRIGKFARRNSRTLLSAGLATAALLVGLAVAAAIWLNAALEKRERIAHANDLIEQAEDHLAKNADPEQLLEDASHFLAASALAKRTEEALHGIRELDPATQARHERLQGAVEAERRVRDLITDIEEALVREVADIDHNRAPNEATAGQGSIAEAFDTFGLPVLELPAADCAQRILKQRVAVRSYMIAGLDQWARSVNEEFPRRAEQLNKVLEHSDSDPWRISLREALRGSNGDALEILSSSEELLNQPPVIVMMISSALTEAQMTAPLEKLLRRAQREAPESFWTNFALGSALVGSIDRSEGDDLRYLSVHIGDMFAGGEQPGVAADSSRQRPGFDEGVGFLRAALAARPSSGVLRLMLGMALVGSGNLEEALQTTWKGRALCHDKSAFDGLLGTILIKLGREDEALPHLWRAVGARPNSAVLKLQIGMTLGNLGQIEKSRAVLLEVAELMDNKDRTVVGDDSAKTTGESIRMRDLTGAEVEFNATLVDLFVGQAHFDNGDVDRALTSAELALDADPDNVGGHVLRGQALLAMGEVRAAAAAFEDADRIAPFQSEFQNALGMSLLQAGDTDLAVDHFQQAVEPDPEDALARANLGTALFQLGRADEAQRNLEKSVEVDPRCGLGWSNLGSIHHKAGRHEQAIECFEQALAIDPEFSLALTNLTILLSELERFDTAIETCKKPRYGDAVRYPRTTPFGGRSNWRCL